MLCAVAKPLVAKSHELSLAYDPSSLTKLEPPLVLQEFVNHGTPFDFNLVVPFASFFNPRLTLHFFSGMYRRCLI